MRKVLIVDDNLLNRTLLHKILEQDYEVLETTDGKKALEELYRYGERISAVLLDIMMPEVDGYEVLTVMRADTRLAAIPVIVTTGNTEEGAELKALSLGANDYITKPYTPDIIKHRLWNTINLQETAAVANFAMRDKLTGLYNREAFFEQAEELIHSKPTGYYLLACFDIDNFKVINDQYGSLKGDEILRQIAKVFQTGFAQAHGICSRITADNFAVLYPESFKETEAIQTIRHTASVLDNSILPLSFSIGRYLVDDLSLTVSAMYDRASLALSSIKGRYDIRIAQYDESMRQKLLIEQTITSEMNIALKNRQFEVWLQPQYNHANQTLIGAEALVRWRHPQKGMIMPGVFIPVFERNGFIYELDKYVWEESCILLRKWLDGNKTVLPISVNISRYDVYRDDLIDTLLSLMKRYQLPVELLHLEITESAFAQSSEQIIAVVKQLVSDGFTVEIDDFGSGYSSLNTLKDVPANILKLDMRFLENDENSDRGGNILESIVRMAKWLDMSVIAEGVETAPQAEYLKSIGCTKVQGYLYSKPLSVYDYEMLSSTTDTEQGSVPLLTVENLDNNAFWNPKSMETLIFNSYVGGACIFEWCNDKIEILRANEKYIRTIAGPSCTIQDALNMKWEDYMDGKTTRITKDAIVKAIESGDDVTYEAVYHGLPGTSGKTYLRTTFRVIAKTVNRFLLYATNENITQQCEAILRMKETDEQLKYFNRLSHQLLTETDTKHAMKKILQEALAYFQADRVFLYESKYDQGICINTYEVCKEGEVSYRDQFLQYPLQDANVWMTAFQSADVFYMDEEDFLRTASPKEQKVYQTIHAHCLMGVALKTDSKLLGALGIINPTQKAEERDSAVAFGDYITTVLLRRDLFSKIENDQQNLRDLMNDTPGGFARMHVGEDNTLHTDYINDGFCELRGMDRETILKADQADAMLPVHPDDQAVVRKTLQEMIETKEPRSIQYRLLQKDGSYRWLKVFGRVTENETGMLFVNAYFTDLEQQEKQELSFKEMLRMVVEHSARVIYRYDIQTKEAFSVVPETSKAMGVPEYVSNMPESLIEQGIIVPEDATYVRQLFASAYKRDASELMRFRVRTTQNDIRWLDVKYSFVPEQKGHPVAIISFADVTEQHEQEISYARYLQSIDSNTTSETIFFEVDVTADSVEKQGGDLLPATHSIIGRRYSHVIRHCLTEYFRKEDRNQARELFSRAHLLTSYADRQRELSSEWQVQLTDSMRWLLCTVQMVKDPYTLHIKAFIVIKDITANKQLSLETKQRAETDGMTGLYNKITTELLVKQRLLLKESFPCAVLIADLDDLKQINDRYGHKEGDMAIEQFAKILRGQFRKSDIIGRIGGDEFMIFLGAITEVSRLRTMMRNLMMQLTAINNLSLPLHGSIGIAVANNNQTSYEELYRKADLALYHVKRNGKDNYAIYQEEMEEKAYRYQQHDEKSFWQNSFYNQEELNELLQAIAEIYPLVMLANLSQNSYVTLKNEKYESLADWRSNNFEELVMEKGKTFHLEDQKAFLQTFSRTALLTAYQQGKRKVSTVKRLSIEGKEDYQVETTVVFLQKEQTEDVLGVIFAHKLDL